MANPRLPQLKKLIKEMEYKENGLSKIDFHGTRSDYQVDMLLGNLTPKGNLKVREITGTKQGGIPSSFRNRIAQLNTDYDGEPYWFINDGTGSLVLKKKYFKPRGV